MSIKIKMKTGFKKLAMLSFVFLLGIYVLFMFVTAYRAISIRADTYV